MSRKNRKSDAEIAKEISKMQASGKTLTPIKVKSASNNWQTVKQGSHVAVGHLRPLAANFRAAGSSDLSPLVTKEEDEAIKTFLNEAPLIRDFKLEDFNLDKPIVNDEEQSVINTFYDQNPKLKNSYVADVQLESLYNNAWIQTYSGRKFYPLNPHIDSIVIQDIAHALSLICRFAGHCREFYSIAQHCVLVSYLCDNAFALQGVLHDASEGLGLQDIPTPLKRTPMFAEYKKAEKHLQTLIYRRFGCQEEEHPTVKKADVLMLATEARELLSPLHSEWKLPCAPLPFKIEPLSPKEAEQLFLNRFNELFIESIVT